MWICDTCKLPRYDSPVGLTTPQCMCMWRQNTAPPKREWVGLTDEEIDAIAEQLDNTTIGWSTHEFARAIEDEIRAKNGF